MSNKHKNITYTIFLTEKKWIKQPLFSVLAQLKRSIHFLCPLFLFSFLFLVAGIQQSIAQISPVYINAKQETLSSKPDKVITTSLKISNDSAYEFTLQPKIVSPSGWKIITQKSSFKLPAHGTQIKLLSIKIPQNTLAQPFPIEYFLTTEQQDTIAKIALQVQVEPERIITIKPIEVPQFVMAGEAFNAAFLVQNDGNVTDRLDLETRNCNIIGEKAITLTPGQSQRVQIEVKTSKEIRRLTRHSFWLKAQLALEKVAEAYSFVRVIPVLPDIEDNYRKLPAKLRLSYIGRDRGEGYENLIQGELQIQGELDSAGTKKLEIGIRPQNYSNGNFGGQPEEYFAGYQTPDFQVFVGDKTFELSPVTEFARYARGIETSYRRGKEELGVFYERPRFFPEIEHELGLYLKHHKSEQEFYSFNFLKKKYVEQVESVHLFSNYNIINIGEHSTIVSDIAIDSKGGWGSFLGVTSNPNPKFNISTTLILASRTFQGFYNNTRNISGSTGYRISPKINLVASLSQDARNVQQDTLFNNAPLSKRAQVGAVTRVNDNIHLRLYYQQYEREDRSIHKRFHRQENTYRLFLLRKGNKIDWTLLNELGTSINFLSPNHDEHNLYRGSLTVKYQPNKRYGLQAFSQYVHRSIQSQNTQRLTYGASFRAFLRSQTIIRARFQSNYAIEEYYRDRNLCELSVQQRIGHQHLFSFSYRYALIRQTVADKNYQIAANYTLNFAIPLEKRIRKGDLHGQIINDGVDKVSGIILTLAGRTAITDEDGHFTFRKVPSGKHYLIMDRSTVRLYDIIKGKSPIQINMPEGRDTTIQLTLMQGASLTGKLVYEQGDKSLLSFQAADFPFAGTLVELQNENETEIVRQLTDEKGHFSIQNLQSGKWTFRVVLNQSHKHLKFDRTTLDLELKPGQPEDITITAKQKKRQIKFQKSMNLSVGKGGK